MAGVPWSQIQVTLPAAMAASWVSLFYRYRGRGRPFGSPRAAAWALTVIVATGAVATAVALGLPEAVAQLPPVTIGLFVPTLLCASRAISAESPVERSVWYPIATAGVTLLLDRLAQQMYADRDAWCETWVSRVWTLEQLEEVSWEVHALLAGRIDDRRRLSRLRSDFDAVSEAIVRAERVGHGREARRARHAAEQALRSMLGCAYDWGCTDVDTSSIGVPGRAGVGSLSAPRPGLAAPVECPVGRIGGFAGHQLDPQVRVERRTHRGQRPQREVLAAGQDLRDPSRRDPQALRQFPFGDAALLHVPADGRGQLPLQPRRFILDGVLGLPATSIPVPTPQSHANHLRSSL